MKFKTSTENKSTDFERAHIEEGIYTATLKEVKEISEGTYGARVAFVYEVEGKEIALICYSAATATPGNRLGQTLLAHGVDLAKGDLDTEAMPQKQVKAWIEDYEFDKDGKKELASSISKVKLLVEKVE